LTREFRDASKFNNITDLLSTDDALFELPDIKKFKIDAKSPWKRKKFDEGGHEEDDMEEVRRLLNVVRFLKPDDDKPKPPHKPDHFKDKIKDKKDKRKPERKIHIDKELEDAKRKRIDFVKSQERCFKRLFKITAGVMCLTCDANYTNFFDKPDKKDGKFHHLKMADGVCSRLMKDCHPYLVAQNTQGRIMVDMRKFKKILRLKSKIEVKISDLEDKISNMTNTTQAIEVLHSL